MNPRNNQVYIVCRVCLHSRCQLLGRCGERWLSFTEGYYIQLKLTHRITIDYCIRVVEFRATRKRDVFFGCEVIE